MHIGWLKVDTFFVRPDYIKYEEYEKVVPLESVWQWIFIVIICYLAALNTKSIPFICGYNVYMGVWCIGFVYCMLVYSATELTLFWHILLGQFGTFIIQT